MDAATLYTLLVCAGMVPPCDAPLGRSSLTREQCVEHMWMIRAGDKTKRLICTTKRREDVIDSAELSPTYDGNRMDMLGQPTSR